MFSSFSTFQSLLENSSTETTPQTVEIPNKLVYYTFDNLSGTTVFNEWSNPLHATATSTDVISSADKVKGNNSGSFSSTLALQLSYNTFYKYFNPSNGVSYSLWVKRTGTPSGDCHVVRWISSNYANNGGTAMLYRPSNNTFGWGSVFNNTNMFMLPNNAGLNTWNHVVLCATIDNRLTVFVN